MNFVLCVFIYVLSQFVGLAWADNNIYQYKNKDGNWVFTNKPVKNGQKLSLPPLAVYSSPITKKDYTNQYFIQKAPISTKTALYNKSNDYNKVSYSGKTETGRKQILNEELLHEKQALSDSEQVLASARQTRLPSEKNKPEQYQARLQMLQDTVEEHQKNIIILSNQLGIAN